MDELLEKKIFDALRTPTLDEVGSRIYPDVLPQQCEMPAIAYFVVSDVPESSLNGALERALLSARVQIDVYATTRESASTISLKVRNIIHNLKGPSPELAGWFESSRNLFDDVSQLFRCSMDFSIQR